MADTAALVFPYLPEEDRKTIENKYHKTDEAFDSMNRMAYHGYAYDAATGMADEEIKAGLASLAASMQGEGHPIIKARMVEYVLDHTRIDINEHDYFIGLYSWGRLIDPYTVDPWYRDIRESVAVELGNQYDTELEEAGLGWIRLDFDHAVPDWDSLAALGFPGLLARLERAYGRLQASGQISKRQQAFYTATCIEYKAVLRLIERLYRYAQTKQFAKAPFIAESLAHLLAGPPQTTLDMLQLIYLYFMISECIGHYQVRSLGYGLDGTLYPFFVRDLESGLFTREQLTAFLSYFLMQFSAMGNYWGQPFYLGGTGADGRTKVNELSHLILQIYDALGLYNPKIQIKVGKSTPRDFLDRVLTMIKGGLNSIVFCNEEVIIKALMHGGATYEEACEAVIKGCYEYAVKADSIPISYNMINALKPIVLVFHNGRDPRTGHLLGCETGDVISFADFAQFYNAYRAQLACVIDKTMVWVERLERHVHEVNPCLLYSGTVSRCVESLTDAMDGGVHNVTDMWFSGFGSAVDALMAVYELVFETGVTTLATLKEALDRNWEGYEQLRLRAQACRHKYGRGDSMADAYACALHRFFSSCFAGRKNCHGGNIEYELHSARAYLAMGDVTEATPDGRRAGEETSKNASPSNGADNAGVTALIRSATSLDLSLADSGACLDCMLHPSALQGEGGVDVLYGILRTYHDRGGASIHFNVFSVDMLRDAQAHPEKYQTLQVRVCGWNVLWNNLEKREQDAYIKRAEGIAS
ncbi:MAG: hypothetical protein J6D31_09255 [Clostridia bacterium]|nr:hypothetical protein [Clostridia bacterium]